MTLLAYILLIILVCTFGFVVFFGAPYLPTLRPQMDAALDLLDLKEGQTMLELGSGDGRVMIAAAERGWNVIGYELNPALALYSWLRTRKYGRRVKVRWGNFWWGKLPHADGVFVFLLQKYMPKLDKKITQEMSKPVKLVSFVFTVPDRQPERAAKSLHLYIYK